MFKRCTNYRLLTLFLLILYILYSEKGLVIEEKINRKIILLSLPLNGYVS